MYLFSGLITSVFRMLCGGGLCLVREDFLIIAVVVLYLLSLLRYFGRVVGSVLILFCWCKSTSFRLVCVRYIRHFAFCMYFPLEK